MRCRFIYVIFVLIIKLQIAAAVPVNIFDRCLIQYQPPQAMVFALQKNLSWEDIKNSNLLLIKNLKATDLALLMQVKETLLTTENLALNIDKLTLINTLLYSDKLSAEEITRLSLDEIFLSTDNQKILAMYKHSVNYLYKFQNNFIFGKFLKSISTLFDQIYKEIKKDPEFHNNLSDQLRSRISPNIHQLVSEQIDYLKKKTSNSNVITQQPVKKNNALVSILNDGHLSLGDPQIVKAILAPEVSLSWHWPFSKMTFDSFDQKQASFAETNSGTSLIFQNTPQEAKIIGDAIQIPTLHQDIAIQLYPPTSFDQSPFSYAYTKNYSGRIPKTIIDSINLFDKTLRPDRVSFLTVSNSKELIGTMRIYQIEQKPPLDFELQRRGIKLDSEKIFRSWIENGKPVFELGRFTLAETATKSERESFFRFLDLAFYNLARLYPDAEFICETGKSSLYRMYRMKWGFDLLEPVIKTDIDEVHILSVNAQTLLQKTKLSLESLIQN